MWLIRFLQRSLQNIFLTIYLFYVLRITHQVSHPETFEYLLLLRQTHVEKRPWNFILYIADDTAICRNQHNSWNWNSRVSIQSGYKHTFCQNLVSTKKKRCVFLYFCENMTNLNVGLLRICQVFSVSYKIAYRWVMTNCCFVSDI